MTTLRVLLSRILEIVLGRRRDARLDEEIRAHLDLLTEDYIARGMTPADARSTARRSFGGVDQLKENYRDQRGLPFMDALVQDLRFALRLLRRDRAFSIAAVSVLALGIGVNNMLFTILNAHTLRGLPLPNANRVLSISTFDDRNQDRGVSYPEFVDLRGAAQSFVGLVGLATAPVIVSGDGQAADRLEGAFISGDAFTVIGGQPVIGRGLVPDDERSGAPPVALIGRGVWLSRYGGDRGVLGRSILVNGAPTTIVGVMRDRSGIPSTAEVWLPLAQLPGLTAQKRIDRVLRVFGRVRDGVSMDDARAEVQTITDRLFRDHPDTSKNIRTRVVPINERYFGRWTDPAWFAFMTAGFLIVLISAANVANLMLARAFHRTREVAIRTSLGASRARVVRQLLIEGSTLAALGGLFGLGLAIGGVRAFRSAIPTNVLPYWFDYSIDGRVVAALVAVSFGTVFVFALLPAIHASKTDVNRVLKEGGLTTTGARGARRWTTAFLTAEFALTVVLLAQVSMSLRSGRSPLPSERAIDTREIITAAVTLPAEKYRAPQQRTEFYRQLSDRLRTIPDVAAVSVASSAPLAGAAEARIEVAGRPRSDDASRSIVRTVAIGPGYFETLKLALVRGRALTDDDGTVGDAPVVVNEELVRQFFSGSEPIGQRLAVRPPNAPHSPPNWGTIVGVAPDIRQRPGNDPDPIVYVPYARNPAITATLLVRSRNESTALGPQLREAVAALDSNLPLYRMQTLAEAIRDAQWNGRVAHMLILVLTVIAVGLSTVGLYAVTAHAVSQRTHEIGVRMALGARPHHVARIILLGALVQLAIGFFAGVVCAKLWDGVFSTGQPGIRASDPGSLLTVAGLLAIVALIACTVPARRATRLDPVAAIRHE